MVEKKYIKNFYLLNIVIIQLIAFSTAGEKATKSYFNDLKAEIIFKINQIDVGKTKS